MNSQKSEDPKEGTVPLVLNHCPALPLFYDFDNSVVEKISDKISRQFEENTLKLPIHDWAKIAEGLGVTGITVDQPEDLAPAFKRALSLNKPVLIDIRTGNYATPVKVSPF